VPRQQLRILADQVHLWGTPFAAQSRIQREGELDAIAGRVNPRARCIPAADPNGARLAWEVTIDPDADPRPPPPELALAKISRGAGFRFEQRRRLRV